MSHCFVSPFIEQERRIINHGNNTEREKCASTFDQRKFLLGAVSALAVGIVAGFGAKLLAGGSAGAYNSSAVNTGDTAWVLTAAALVMLMTPAVGFFYGGMVRSKNVVSVIKQSVVILALVSIQWV